jgi:hypothetical protein
MIDSTFDTCVWLLLYLADQIGVTYKEINVWIFVIIWPVLTIFLVLLSAFQQIMFRRWRRRHEAYTAYDEGRTKGVTSGVKIENYVLDE